MNAFAPASATALNELSKFFAWFAPLTASAQSAQDAFAQDANQDRTGLDPNSPIFRMLVAGILYSRWLALTYYAVVAGILLVFVAANWIPNLRLWFKRRSERQGRWSHSIVDAGNEHAGLKEQQKKWDALVREDHDDQGSSSGSSSPARVTQHTDEHTPLLAGRPNAGQHQQRSVLTRWWRYTASWFVYQPESLPGFRNRVMSSNGTTILMLAYLGINLFYLLFNIDFSVRMIFILADRAAVLFVTNLPILYVLSAKNQPLQPLVGYSYASLNIVHRRLGEWMCLLALVHGSLMVVVWATLLRPNGYEFIRFISDRVVILGLGAFVCYEGLYFTSLATVRQKAYEVFLASHILLHIGALAFLWFHHTKSRTYVAISVAVWALDRFVYRLGVKINTYKAALAILPDGETISVSVSVPLKPASWTRKLLGMRSVGHGWKTLDHVFLSIPTIAHKHVVQAHPFSIASAAPSPDAQSAELMLIIRARDGFSKDLLVYAAEHNTVNVRIDGPYGAHESTRLLQNTDARVIVAGGSGIAVTYPLLEKIIAEEDSRFDDVEHATHIGTSRSILFVWVVHRKEQWKWIDMERLQMLGRRAGVELVLPGPTHEAGRPDLDEITTAWIDAKNSSSSFGMVVSGPDGMSRDVRNQCATLKARGLDVHVEVEKYGW